MLKFNQKFSHRSDLLYYSKRDTISEETRSYILSGSRVFAFEEYSISDPDPDLVRSSIIVGGRRNEWMDGWTAR